MKRLGWHSMSLSRRVLLLLTLVLVSAAVQISIAQIQNLHVFRPMEENAEQIQTISQFLHETEKCIGTLEEYHWEYGDPDALNEEVRSSMKAASDHLSSLKFRDGAVMAQLGVPDMRIPIQLALTYPDREEAPCDYLDLLTCGSLSFLPPDPVNFPCLAYAREAAARGGTACAILNGANEAAVGLFLRDRIGFGDIPRRVRRAMDTVAVTENPTLEDILKADAAAREAVES